MKNKKIWLGMLGMLVMVLVFGMSVIGCDTGNGGGGGSAGGTWRIVNNSSVSVIATLGFVDIRQITIEAGGTGSFTDDYGLVADAHVESVCGSAISISGYQSDPINANRYVSLMGGNTVTWTVTDAN